MDGLLIVDKPVGPTSHDVVARARRALGERRIGHTGTLDPAASGVLPLVVGRATRLARFLSSSDKEYAALVRLGVATETYDADGRAVGPAHVGAWPSAADIDRALDAFRGEFLQRPPIYSAKKIGGRPSYELARAQARADGRLKPGAPDMEPCRAETGLEPVLVATHALDIVDVDEGLVSLRIECSSGFYVRSLAHDLGERLGVGAHLAGLRRTRSADFTVADALALDELDRDPAAAVARIVPLAAMLPRLPAVVLTDEGVRFLAHGRSIAPRHVVERREGAGTSVRLMGMSGDLLGVAEPADAPGFLHPSLVLM